MVRSPSCVRVGLCRNSGGRAVSGTATPGTPVAAPRRLRISISWAAVVTFGHRPAGRMRQTNGAAPCASTPAAGVDYAAEITGVGVVALVSAGTAQLPKV